MSEPRKPGRPRGTGKNDSQHLAAIAGLVLASPDVKHTTLMRRYLRTSGKTFVETDDTLIRRWQDKWAKDKEALLEAARQRQAKQRVVRRDLRGGGSSVSVSDIARGYMSPMQRMIADSSTLNYQRMIAESPAMVAQREIARYADPLGIRDLTESMNPLWRVHKQIEETQRLQDLIDPPHLRDLRRMMGF